MTMLESVIASEPIPTASSPVLDPESVRLLEKQDERRVPAFKAAQFEQHARKHWDLFYKRNETRFFKDRHWTTREFKDLADFRAESRRVLLEVGCGVCNFVWPLLQDEDVGRSLFVFACDFSPRAVDLVKANSFYDETRIKAFQCDISQDGSLSVAVSEPVDIASMVFVLSAIAPRDFSSVFRNIHSVMKSGGVLLFRDYAVGDMTMVRFGPGTKIDERHYLRHDGTTSYFFTTEEIEQIARDTGFKVKELQYVQRRTVNKKENVDVDRFFLQGVFEKE